MKKYVIFGWAGGIAGGMIYTDNKCRFLLSKGYDVYIIYSAGNVVLNHIKMTHSMKCEYISYYPSSFSKKMREKTIDNFCKFIGDASDVFIESNDIKYSYWAELLARKINCKHFLFALEGYISKSDNNNKYLQFKLNRKELAGTRKQSLIDLFDGTNVVINDLNNRYFNAYCSNSVSDIPYESQIKWDDYDWCITYVGRESKPFFKYIPNELVDFIKNNQKKKILILLLGCEKDVPSINKFKNNIAEYQNAELIITGRLFPIPLELIKNSSVIIGSSGCATVGASYDVPTIRYLDGGTSPMGVIGYDIDDLSSVEKKYEGTLSELLDDICNRNYLSQFSYKKLLTFPTEQIIDREFEQALREMTNETSQEYFDTHAIRQKGILGVLRLYKSKIMNFLRV